MSLREEVIQRVFEECGDFVERTGVSEEEACRFADHVGRWLSLRFHELLPGLFPLFTLRADGNLRIDVLEEKVFQSVTLLGVERP